MNAAVVVIANRGHTVALWHQRAAEVAGEPVIWDYHVIVVSRDPSVARIWDLDTTLGFPMPAPAYLDQTFRGGVRAALVPSFRVIEAADYRREFASDRGHMRDADGGWQQPPPPWPPIGRGHTLDALLDADDPRFGPWLVRAALPWG